MTDDFLPKHHTTLNCCIFSHNLLTLKHLFAFLACFKHKTAELLNKKLRQTSKKPLAWPRRRSNHNNYSFEHSL